MRVGRCDLHWHWLYWIPRYWWPHLKCYSHKGHPYDFLFDVGPLTILRRAKQ